MFHQIRWTAQKISQRLALVDSLVYRRRIPLPNFCFLKLIGPEETPPIAADVDDSNWLVVEPGTIWAKPDTNFILRTQFQLPANWDTSLPIALYLPIGEAGDFSHPEALVYVDGSRVIDFFRNLEETVDDRLPTWNGELYLEYHRGTYTTQARNKRANRKCEFLLHDAEFLASWASVYWVNTISATVFCHTLARSATKP